VNGSQKSLLYKHWALAAGEETEAIAGRTALVPLERLALVDKPHSSATLTAVRLYECKSGELAMETTRRKMKQCSPVTDTRCMVKVWAWQLCGLHTRGIEASGTLPQNISNEHIPDTNNDWCRRGFGVGSDVLLIHDALDSPAVPGVDPVWQRARLRALLIATSAERSP